MTQAQPPAQSAQSATLPCPKVGCAGRVAPVNSWPSKQEKHMCMHLECPICHVRDFQTFPVPDEVISSAKPFEFGSVVEHAIHGKGMVVKSGPNFTQVCFQGRKGKETDCLTADLKLAPGAEDLNAYRETLDAVEGVRRRGVKGSGKAAARANSSIDPETPPGDQDDRPGGGRDMHCELCGQEETKLVFTEQLWICRMCREFCELGEKTVGMIVRGSE